MIFLLAYLAIGVLTSALLTRVVNEDAMAREKGLDRLRWSHRLVVDAFIAAAVFGWPMILVSLLMRRTA